MNTQAEPRRSPGQQGPRAGREHPYPCRTPAQGTAARLGPLLAWWCVWSAVVLCVVATAAAMRLLNDVTSEAERYERCMRAVEDATPETRAPLRRLCEAAKPVHGP